MSVGRGGNPGGEDAGRDYAGSAGRGAGADLASAVEGTGNGAGVGLASVGGDRPLADPADGGAATGGGPIDGPPAAAGSGQADGPPAGASANPADGAPAGGPAGAGPRDAAPDYRPIVVGVDGSPVSRDALSWAVREAELRGCELVVVYGWQVSTEPRPPGTGIGVAPPLEAYQEQASEKLRRIVAETVGPDRPRPPARLTLHAAHRTPGRALMEESEDAELLVVGSKGHGRLAAWLLGSISEEAMQRAPCSVVVVRPHPGRERAR